jgi:hypothetical protein
MVSPHHKGEGSVAPMIVHRSDRTAIPFRDAARPDMRSAPISSRWWFHLRDTVNRLRSV